MRLYLVQHGEALSKEQDPDRPLSTQGKDDITRLTSLLDKQHASVHLILHSEKTRARQTAELLTGILAPDGHLEQSSVLNPADSTSPIISWINSQHKDVLVVGHMPFIGRLVSFLVTQNEDKTITQFTPGTLVCLESNDHTDWKISTMIAPNMY